jgi:fructose/tagatose bisphosphate aldolase
VFLQGDHFQVNAKKYAADPDKEFGTVRDLALEALLAGFLNIDIDTSTLVDLSRPTIAEQQEINYRLCAELTAFIRRHEPQGLTISVGGEIGEVGGKNSTEEELRAFIDGYRAALAGLGAGLAGISKISVQTGTSHGGVVLADGTIANVAVDFDATRAPLARRARGLRPGRRRAARREHPARVGLRQVHRSHRLRGAPGYRLPEPGLRPAARRPAR